MLQRSDGVQVDGQPVAVHAVSPHRFIFKAMGVSHSVMAAAWGDQIHLQLNGRSHVIERIDPTRSDLGASSSSQGSATAPMPGMVVQWLAQPGASVCSGDPLLVIESMKLQMTIEAPATGTLQDMPFQVGQTFQRGAVLARVMPQESRE